MLIIKFKILFNNIHKFKINNQFKFRMYNREYEMGLMNNRGYEIGLMNNKEYEIGLMNNKEYEKEINMIIE